MDVKRVHEIIQSDKKIHVEYQGTSIWIDSVEGQMARVHTVANPNETKMVEITHLKEQ